MEARGAGSKRAVCVVVAEESDVASPFAGAGEKSSAGEEIEVAGAADAAGNGLSAEERAVLRDGEDGQDVGAAHGGEEEAPVGGEAQRGGGVAFACAVRQERHGLPCREAAVSVVERVQRTGQFVDEVGAVRQGRMEEEVARAGGRPHAGDARTVGNAATRQRIGGQRVKSEVGDAEPFAVRGAGGRMDVRAGLPHRMGAVPLVLDDADGRGKLSCFYI